MKHATVLTLAMLLAITTIVTTSSCSKNDSSPTPAPLTLYDTLGGSTMVSDPAHSGTMIEKGRLGIRSVIDSAIFIIAGDTAINGYFTVLLSEVTSGNLTGFEALSGNLTDFFCVGTGAKDFTYKGKSMHDAHDPSANARISGKVQDDDFTSFELDIVASAHKNGLPDNIIARFGTILESLRTSVVNQ